MLDLLDLEVRKVFVAIRVKRRPLQSYQAWRATPDFQDLQDFLELPVLMGFQAPREGLVSVVKKVVRELPVFRELQEYLALPELQDHLDQTDCLAPRVMQEILGCLVLPVLL